MPEIRNPTELRAALGFAALYALVLLLVAWLAALAGSRGVYAVAVVSGLSDVDAITLSSPRVYRPGALSAGETTTSIVLAVVANVAFKPGIVCVVGGSALFRRCLLAMTATAAGGGLGLALFARPA